MSRRQQRPELVIRTGDAGKHPRRRTSRGAGEVSVVVDGGAIRADLEAERQRRRKSRMTYRLRRQLWPWYVAVGLLAFVAFGWGLDASPTHSWSTAGIVLVVTGLFAAFGSGQVPPMWRRRVWSASVLGSAWMGAAMAAGPSWTAVLVLLLLTVSVSLPWWRHHRIGYPDGPLVDEPAEDVGVVARWTKYVASSSGPLPDSFLTGRTEVDSGEQFTVNLAPGRQTLSTALTNLDRVASGIDLPASRFVLEQHDSGSPTKLALTVVERSPVERTVTYPGPSMDGGIVHLGPYADGDGLAPWRLWTPGEVDHSGSWWGGVVVGGIGSGKSRLLEEIAIGAMSTGYTLVWFVDPQGGASSPALAKHADWYADLASAGEVLAVLERVAAARADENAARGWVGFDPSQARPGILVIIDESHEVFIDPDRWEALARKTRKVGIGFMALSQYPGLTTFGGSEPLRAAVMAGNGIAMHASSRQNKTLMPGLEVDPLDLPKNLPGFGYTLSSGGFGRTAPFRTFYVAKPGEWMTKYRQPKLDPLAADAAGDLYTSRHERADSKRAELLAKVERMAGGDSTTGADATPRPPRFPELPAVFTKPAPDPQLTGAQARVWDALGREERTFKELAATTGWGTTRLNNVLRQLADAGLVVKPGHGRYRRAQ